MEKYENTLALMAIKNIKYQYIQCSWGVVI